MKILVLDDNPEAAKVVETFLAALDHQVVSYTDGQEALLWLNDFKPELIISDLEMPEMDGYAFIKQVRARSAFARTPVICITGTDETDTQISAHGFAAVLRKPTTLSDVMTIINEVTSGLQTATPQPAAPQA